MRGINVLVVEQQEVVRCGLTTMLSSIPEVSSCLSAPTISACGEDTLHAADVALLSITALNDVESSGSDIERFVRIVAVVSRPEPDQFEQASRSPARGYVIQDTLTVDQLRAALSNVCDDQLTLPPEMVSYLLNRTNNNGTTFPHPVHLNPREHEVLDLLVNGSSNKEIAVQLGLSIHSVKRHVSSILNKFNSPSRVHLVSRFLRSGLVPD